LIAQTMLLGPGDAHVLDRVAPDAFDDPISPQSLARFLDDPRHHIVVALEDGLVVGFVSALHCEHPDKTQPELWINEVGVAAAHRRQGVARRMLDAMLAHAWELGCGDAWVLTDRSNQAAMRLYASRTDQAPSDHVMFTFHLDAARGGY
jgi:ribosomal protein S18 acetylase RimI-like enzyme